MTGTIGTLTKMAGRSGSEAALGLLADEALLEAARMAPDDDVRGSMISELHRRGSANICDLAMRLAASTLPPDREIAAEVLGDLGAHEDHPYAERSLPTLIGLAGDSAVCVASAAIRGLGRLRDQRAGAIVLGKAAHPRSEVRLAVARSLPSFTDEGPVAPTSPIVQTLLELMTDAEDEVRDWATFGLGRLVEVDGGDVRRALGERLHDSDAATRREALIGLARRRDPRAVGAMLAASERGEDGEVLVRVAELLRSPALLPAIARFRATADDPSAADLAIARCDPARQAEEMARLSELVEMAERELPDLELVATSEVMPVDDGGVVIHVRSGSRSSAYDFDALIERAGGSTTRAVELMASDRAKDAARQRDR